MEQCQLTSAVALRVQPEDVTPAVGNIPPPLNFNIQGVGSIPLFSNAPPPPARYSEMAGLPCVWGYYSLPYSAAVKGRALLKTPLGK